uniref:Uncharacterized protein n=1 Tax=Arion vulgaris TaxID=1028688 RepID=A0A0B7AQT3_9EUPU
MIQSGWIDFSVPGFTPYGLVHFCRKGTSPGESIAQSANSGNNPRFFWGKKYTCEQHCLDSNLQPSKT